MGQMNIWRLVAGVWAAFALLSGCAQHAAASFAERAERGELSVEAFRSSSVDLQGSTVRVGRDGPNAMGALFRLGPEAENRRFAAAFRTASDGRVTLRSLVNGELVYASGDEGFLVLGGSVSEVILYSENATAIEITFEEVIDCTRSNEGPCYTMDDLRREIFPNGEPRDRREHLLALLNWASNNADYAATPQINQLGRAYIARYDPALMYSMVYTTDIAGGYCGTNAAFLAGLLRAFGYDAMTINYGVLNPELTHVTTLVYNPFGDERIYVLDPTFNAHIVNRQTGAWASFDEILSQPPERFDVAAAPMPARDFVFEGDHVKGNMALEGNHQDFNQCRRGAAANTIVCRYEAFSISSYLATYRRPLDAAGLPATPEGFLRLFRTRYFSAGGGGSETARAELTALLRAHGFTVRPRGADE